MVWKTSEGNRYSLHDWHNARHPVWIDWPESPAPLAKRIELNYKKKRPMLIFVRQEVGTGVRLPRRCGELSLLSAVANRNGDIPEVGHVEGPRRRI